MSQNKTCIHTVICLSSLLCYVLSFSHFSISCIFNKVKKEKQVKKKKKPRMYNGEYIVKYEMYNNDVGALDLHFF